MHFNLEQVSFSCRGSYIAVSYLPENYRELKNQPGIYLKNLHGAARYTSVVARLVPTLNGQEIACTWQASPAELTIDTQEGSIRVCFADAKTLLLKGDGAVGLRLDLNVGDGKRNKLIYTLCHQSHTYYTLNVNKNFMHYVAAPLLGDASFAQEWSADGYASGTDACTFSIAPQNNGFFLALEEVPTQWHKKEYAFDYDTCKQRMQMSFEAFCETMPSIPERFADAHAIASYINWSSLVAKNEFLTREAMLMSKNWMTNIWAWDHCYNAIALAAGDPMLAFDQFMLLFDYQDSTGRIPDSINDAGAWWNWVKPPIHGWAFLKMMQRATFTSNQLMEVYTRLERFTNWWLTYRDTDNDGICEYYHGNDSGWDNASTFHVIPNVELPDLSAFLIIQMQALGEIATRLGWDKQALLWMQQADVMLEKMLAHSFENGRPVARINGTHELVPSDSLLLYLPVLLGNRLPQDIRTHLVETLKSDQFLTPYGFATEPPESPRYIADGYWLGPIWAASTMLLVDGLAACGETAFATEIVERFSNLVKQSGCAENYDALTGEGLRDRAYTWTASSFLAMANEYLV